MLQAKTASQEPSLARSHGMQGYRAFRMSAVVGSAMLEQGNA